MAMVAPWLFEAAWAGETADGGAAQQLVANGWREAAIERRGFGLEKPVADNATPEGRAQNRRVVVTVQVD